MGPIGEQRRKCINVNEMVPVQKSKRIVEPALFDGNYVVEGGKLDREAHEEFDERG